MPVRSAPVPAFLAALACAIAIASPAAAQIRTVDPNAAAQSPAAPPPSVPQDAAPVDAPPQPFDQAPADTSPPPVEPAVAPTAPPAQGGREGAENRARAEARGDSYQQQDILDAAENTFGKGAAGLAEIVQRVLKKQGLPNAYIAGREGSGAIGVGLRYGSGTLFHKVEGDMPVYWTGPSLGFDIGANAAKEFVLVYNLYDSADLFHRYPAAEGTLYVVGGFTASYLRRGDVVLIPIRLGVGWRAGVNVGYMNFTRKSRIIPF